MADTSESGGLVDFQPMTPEDMRRAMQFLLNQQAQFAADLTRHREEFAADLVRQREESVADLARHREQFNGNIDKLSAKTDVIADGLIGLTGLVGRIGDAVDRLAAVQLRTDERLRETDARLTTHIEHVESHLNVVVDMFERHLREDHGRSPS
jgi:hypothetical protein